MAPGLLDRYLALTGFDAQQTDQPRDPDAPVNLFAAADGEGGHDFGIHGEFDSRAHRWDPQLWASRHHGALLAAGVAALTGATGWSRSRH